MGLSEQIYVVVSSAIALLVALWLLRPTAGRLTTTRIAFALGATGMFALAKLAIGVVMARSLFFGVTLAYVDIVIVAPLAAALALARARGVGATLGAKWILWSAAIALPAVGLYASFVEPFRLVEERVEVVLPADRAPSSPLRIAVLADLQSREVDDHLREAIRRAMAFEPHLIVLPGDLIQVKGEDAYLRVVDEFRELLAPLDAPLGVYFVLGNTDTTRLVGRVFEGTRVQLLENQVAERDFGGKRVLIAGAGFHPDDPLNRAFTLKFDVRESDELRLLIAHYPDAALNLDATPGIDLVIAGHTHGGQVQIPWFGAPLTLSSVPRAVGSGGLHLLEGRRIYVSRGVGCERADAPRLRFLCPPEVSLLTLRGP